MCIFKKLFLNEFYEAMNNTLNISSCLFVSRKDVASKGFLLCDNDHNKVFPRAQIPRKNTLNILAKQRYYEARRFEINLI